MNCGQIADSIQAWRKISGINMKPKIALAILKYTKKVSDEHVLIEKQRIAMIHDITGTEPGSEVTIEPDTEVFKAYQNGAREICAVETDLGPIDLNFEEVINAVDEKNETLSVSDLAFLEPFFADRPPNLPDDCPPDGDCCK